MKTPQMFDLLEDVYKYPCVDDKILENPSQYTFDGGGEGNMPTRIWVHYRMVKSPFWETTSSFVADIRYADCHCGSVFFQDIFTLPFNEFKFGFLKHLDIAPSQMHSNSWVYVKIFQHQGEYKNNNTNLMLFFHLFHIFLSNKVVRCLEFIWIVSRGSKTYVILLLPSTMLPAEVFGKSQRGL